MTNAVTDHKILGNGVLKYDDQMLDHFMTQNDLNWPKIVKIDIKL